MAIREFESLAPSPDLEVESKKTPFSGSVMTSEGVELPLLYSGNIAVLNAYPELWDYYPWLGELVGGQQGLVAWAVDYVSQDVDLALLPDLAKKEIGALIGLMQKRRYFSRGYKIKWEPGWRNVDGKYRRSISGDVLYADLVGQLGEGVRVRENAFVTFPIGKNDYPINICAAAALMVLDQQWTLTDFIGKVEELRLSEGMKGEFNELASVRALQQGLFRLVQADVVRELTAAQTYPIIAEAGLPEFFEVAAWWLKEVAQYLMYEEALRPGGKKKKEFGILVLYPPGEGLANRNGLIDLRFLPYLFGALKQFTNEVGFVVPEGWMLQPRLIEGHRKGLMGLYERVKAGGGQGLTEELESEINLANSQVEEAERLLIIKAGVWNKSKGDEGGVDARLVTWREIVGQIRQAGGNPNLGNVRIRLDRRGPDEWSDSRS